MRIIAAIAVVTLIAAIAQPASAGKVEDCNQIDDLDLRIGGCTALIRSGEYSGTMLGLIYSNRGLAYKGLGEYRRAIEDYDQALRINPGHAIAYNNRGFVYNVLAWDLYLEGRNAQALADVDRSLSDRPGNAATIDTRAHVLAALGRTREALAEFERAMRIGGAERVRKYQKALARHGYYDGAIDGAYGVGTRAALAACLDAGCRVLE